MWIVKLALSRPYTFIVLAILILVISPLVILRMPTDIFPDINIPVVSVVWGYSGLVGALLDSTVVAYEKALDLTRNRYQGGIASAAEVAQAETQLEATRAQRIDLGVQRAAFEHAIAALVGEPASTFSIAAAPVDAHPPAIPVGLPSDLLQRRPDVAAAERRMASANAQIGVARAAFFPSLVLSATGGFESGRAATWLNGPSLLWSVGSGLVQTLFDGGRRRALSDQARPRTTVRSRLIGTSSWRLSRRSRTTWPRSGSWRTRPIARRRR